MTRFGAQKTGKFAGALTIKFSIGGVKGLLKPAVVLDCGDNLKFKKDKMGIFLKANTVLVFCPFAILTTKIMQKNKILTVLCIFLKFTM